MIHIRVDDEDLNIKRRFACGLGPELPPGDKYFFAGESRADFADCPGCNPSGPRELGTPISQVCGRPGHPGYGEFLRIAQSYGYP